MTADPHHTSALCRAPARDRILAAAERLFSQAAYETVGLRDIAGAADVDVAYAHRLYGSKQALFETVFRTALRREVDRLRQGDDLASVMAAMVVAHCCGPEETIGPGLGIMVQSMTNAEATQALRRVVCEEFVTPLNAQFAPDDGPDHAPGLALSGAIMSGLGIGFQVLKLPALADLAPDDLQERLTRVFRIAGTPTAPHSPETETG